MPLGFLWGVFGVLCISLFSYFYWRVGVFWSGAFWGFVLSPLFFLWGICVVFLSFLCLFLFSFRVSSYLGGFFLLSVFCFFFSFLFLSCVFFFFFCFFAALLALSCPFESFALLVFCFLVCAFFLGCVAFLWWFVVCFVLCGFGVWSVLVLCFFVGGSGLVWVLFFRSSVVFGFFFFFFFFFYGSPIYGTGFFKTLWDFP